MKEVMVLSKKEKKLVDTNNSMVIVRGEEDWGWWVEETKSGNKWLWKET